MSLVRIGRHEESLDEFYSDIGDNDFTRKVIGMLEQKLGDREVYCNRSWGTLFLLSHSGDDGIAWVRISPEVPLEKVKIECIPPSRFVPFAGTLLTVSTSSTEDAVEKILKMMDYSEGWTPENRDLTYEDLDR